MTKATNKSFSNSLPKMLSFDYPEGKQVFVTSDVNVLTKGSSHNMSPCDHKQADARLLLHLVHVDALKNGCSTCIVRTIDTDVIVILIGKFHQLLSINPSVRIWVAFGAVKAFTYININSIFYFLREKNLWRYLCSIDFWVDTTSGFFGRKKFGMGTLEVLS